jgi:SAM-dependent methyltransferase
MTSILQSCKSCGGQLGPVFYEADSVPVHSCLLLASPTDALAFPRANVRLAPCLDCGIITNPTFDKRWSAYSPEYEDQQAFSPTFNSFAGRLAQDLTERHDLVGETVIDIGCSKGDFLALLCEAGAKRGIGIDPSVVEGRVTPSNHGQLDLIEAYYSDHHIDLPARLISNRHTLEHVHDVHDMLSRMHRHAVNAGDAVTFIEVPSMTRVLQDCAFEDIYYEHCSYFTPGALARALRKAGFGVSRLWLDYNDQYLMAEAVTDPSRDRFFDIEESVSEVLSMVAVFEANIAKAQSSWGSLLDMATKDGLDVAIWGSGSKCIAFLQAMGVPRPISRIVDINPNRWGKYPPSLPLPISKPTDLSQNPPDIVIVMNAIYVDEIRGELSALGVNAHVIAVGAASDAVSLGQAASRDGSPIMQGSFK